MPFNWQHNFDIIVSIKINALNFCVSLLIVASLRVEIPQNDVVKRPIENFL